MSTRVGLSVRQLRAAAELRRLRELALFTADEVAGRLGWSASKVSRVENARIRLKPDDMQLLLDLYEVAGERRDTLLKLVEENTHKRWWEAYADVLPQDLLNFISFEAEASGILSFEPMVIPGLLQTEAYARRVIKMWQSVTDAPPIEFERRLEVRMVRQRMMSSDEPLEFSAIIDEAVLRRQIDEPRVMWDQLNHLAEVSELPNVDLRILPLDGLHAISAGPIMILKIPNYGDVLYLETFLDASIYTQPESPNLIYQHNLIFDKLRAEALDQSASRALIQHIASELWTSNSG